MAERDGPRCGVPDLPDGGCGCGNNRKARRRAHKAGLTAAGVAYCEEPIGPDAIGFILIPEPGQARDDIERAKAELRRRHGLTEIVVLKPCPHRG